MQLYEYAACLWVAKIVRKNFKFKLSIVMVSNKRTG